MAEMAAAVMDYVLHCHRIPPNTDVKILCRRHGRVCQTSRAKCLPQKIQKCTEYKQMGNLGLRLQLMKKLKSRGSHPPLSLLPAIEVSEDYSIGGY